MDKAWSFNDGVFTGVGKNSTAEDVTRYTSGRRLVRGKNLIRLEQKRCQSETRCAVRAYGPSRERSGSSVERATRNVVTCPKFGSQ